MRQRKKQTHLMGRFGSVTQHLSGSRYYGKEEMSSQCQQSRVADEDIKAAVKDLTPASTQEIADRIDLSRQAAEYRLKQIEDRWENPWIWSKKIGPTRIWLHAEHVFPR